MCKKIKRTEFRRCSNLLKTVLKPHDYILISHKKLQKCLHQKDFRIYMSAVFHAICNLSLTISNAFLSLKKSVELMNIKCSILCTQVFPVE